MRLPLAFLACVVSLPALAAEYRYCYERPAPDFTFKETKADRLRINEVLMGRLPVAMMERQCGIERPETRKAMRDAIVEAGCSAKSDTAKSVEQLMSMSIEATGSGSADFDAARAANPTEYNTFCAMLPKIDFTDPDDPEFTKAMLYFAETIGPLMMKSKK